MNVRESVPFDAEAFAEELKQTAVVNETEGWVQGVDQVLIQQRLTEYQAQIEAFVNGQKPGAAVGDVLGTRAIIARTSEVLNTHLPYDHVATTDGFASLPQSLRWRFQYTLTDEWGGQLFSFVDSLPRLAGKRLALSFRPATQADEDLITSYLPEPPADGTSIDLATLPKSLSGYLITLIPEWTVDGQVRNTSNLRATMGHELKSQRGLWRPGHGWQLRDKVVTAGQYQALGLDAAGIGAAELVQLQAKLAATKARVEAQDVAALTKHDLTGDILQTGVLLYFTLNDVQDQLAARGGGVVAHRLPSYGAFETTVVTDYWFGLPRNVRFPGVTMDIDHLHSVLVDDQNDSDAFRAFARASCVGGCDRHLEPLIRLARADRGLAWPSPS
jgi:hypothetical protein